MDSYSHCWKQAFIQAKFSACLNTQFILRLWEHLSIFVRLEKFPFKIRAWRRVAHAWMKPWLEVLVICRPVFTCLFWGPRNMFMKIYQKMFLKYKLSKSSIQVSPHPDILQTWAPLLWLFSVLLLVKNL